MPDTNFLTLEEYQRHEKAGTLTLCVACTHFLQKGKNMLDMFCRSSAVQLPPGVNPVTGEKCFITKNSLGMVIFTTVGEPYARDINTHGQCPFYKVKA